jgi:DNA-binding CsgD family transcriptional regulator/tetratricopeptide (TPR) repeat protein
MSGSPDSSTVASRLFGRDRELRQVLTLLANASTDCVPRAVRVYGRSGFGKTVFLDTVAARARDEGWLVFRAGCHPSQRHTAVAALRRLVRTGLDALGPEREKYVSGLESELAASEIHVARYQTAVSRMFEGVLLDRAVLIAVDDAQWLDAESALCLERLLSSARAGKLVLLFGDRRQQGPLGVRIPVAEIALKALDKTAAEQLVENEYPDAVPDVVDAIVERGQGIPFELATLASQAASDRAQSIDDVLKSVKTAIADRIRVLGAPVRDFLQICSLIQEPIEIRILGRLFPDEPELLGLIEAAVPNYLVAESGELRFVHALVGDAIRSTIGVELPLQKRILRALLAAGESDLRSYDRIAHHAFECGEREMEYEYTVRLAHTAFAVEAFDAAIAAFDRALRIQTPPREEYVAFFNEYAMALRVTDRWREARDVLEQALRGEIPGELPGLAVLANALVWCISIEEDNRHAQSRYDQLAGTMNGDERLELLGVGAMLAIEPADAGALAAIRAELEAAGRPKTALAAAYVATGMVEACQGHFPQARDNLQKARALMDPRTIRKFTTDVFGLWVEFFERGCALSQDQIPRLMRRVERELPRAVAHEIVELSLHADFARGRWEEALANVQALDPAAIHSDSRLHALAIAAAITAFTGRTSLYADMIQSDVSAAIRYEYRNRALELGFWWAAHLCALRKAEAASLASKLQPWLAGASWFSAESFFLPIATWLYASRAKDEKLLSELSVREVRAELSPWHRAHELLAVGAAKRSLRPKDGAQPLREAEDLFRGLHCSFYAALAAALLGAAADDDVRLLRALGIAEQTIPQPISALPEKGKRRPGPVALSAREMQVAELVAEGYQNRRIAEELVLSERTVEAHVANVFSKLGLSSRARLARWVVERRSAVA